MKGMGWGRELYLYCQYVVLEGKKGKEGGREEKEARLTS